MMEPTINVTVEDLWPGDVILVRRPGGYSGSPHRLLDVRQGGRVLACVSLDGEREFIVIAPDGYATEVERFIA